MLEAGSEGWGNLKFEFQIFNTISTKERVTFKCALKK
jgi:hypothetical protein